MSRVFMCLPEMTRPLLAISNHATFIGGGEHSFFDLISHLPEECPVIACLPSEDVLAKKTRERGIATVISPLPPIRPGHILRMASSIGRLRDICKTERVSLIYANGSRAAFYGGTVGRLCSIPVIWHCRVSSPDPYLDFLLLRLVDRIIANSGATASRFSSAFQDKIEIVYNGFDLKWLRDSNVPKPVLIEDDWVPLLVVARISRWKRHDLILSAFEHIASVETNTHLICLGERDHDDPSWWNELQEKTITSPFSNRIHWIGAVDDVRPWYRAASLMVLSSTNEAFGRVVVEAMASSVPVVATRSGGIPEIITHMKNGILVPENDAGAISDAVLTILQDPSLKGRLAGEGFKRAECFGIEAHVNKMLEVFTNVVNHQRKN
jgi:glycosyltransferase involved in cell wall biosynthesis